MSQNQPANGPSPLCNGGGTPNNVHWFAFYAGCTDLNLTFTPENCVPVGGQIGIQAAIFGYGGDGLCPSSTQQPDETIWCQSLPCFNNQVIIEANGLQIGKIYYFMIDGCGGSYCDIHIAVNNPCGPLEIGAWPEPIDGPNTVCTGTTETYCVEPPVGALDFFWYLDGIEIQSGLDNCVDINWTDEGTYELCVDVANQCILEGEDPEPLCLTISVGDTPTVNIAGPDEFCEGVFTELDAGGGFSTYLWNTNETSQKIIITQGGAYSVTVSNSSGCTNSDEIDVILLPGVQASASSNSPICEEETLTLNASGGDTYAWIGPNGFASNSQNPTIVNASPANSGEYEVIVTNNDGCADTISLDVIVNPLPIINAQSNNPVCTGDTLMLSAEGGGTYEWEGPLNWTSGEQNPQIINFDLSQEGIYSIKVTTNENCFATEEFFVYGLQSPDPEITGSTTFCEGGNTILMAPGGFEYLWSNFESSQEIYVDQPGTYSVTVTDIEGCTGSDSVEVMIAGELNPEITGDLVLCDGGQGVLNAGPGYAEYTWSNGETTQTINIQNGGTYSVTVSDGVGCEGSDTVTVTEQPAPQGTAGSNSPVCTGQTITLQSSGGATYQWSGPAGFASTQQNPTIPNAQIPNLGIYQVIVTNAQGCKDTVTSFVNVSDGVTLTASVVLPDCSGDTLFLFASGGNEYAWTGPGGYTSQEQNPVIPNAGPPQAGQYVVTDPNAPGCVANDTISIPVPPGPQPNITGNFTICQGEQATLDAGPGFNLYIWNTGQTGQVINTVNPGLYWVIVTDSTGCIGRDSVDVIINQFLDPKLTGKSAVCVGDSSLLSAGPGFADYAWSTGDTLQSIIVQTTGTYSVTVSNASGCTGSDSIAFKVYEQPEIAFEVNAEQCADSCDGSIMILPFEPGYTYKWSNKDSLETISNLCSGVYLVTVTSPGGCFIVDATFVPAAIELNVSIAEGDSMLVAEASGGSPPYSYFWSNGSMEKSIPRVPGMHSVTVTDNHDCDQVATLLITRLEDVAQRGKGFVLYPNPASKQFTLATLDKQPLDTSLNISIWSLSGKAMHRDVLPAGQDQWVIQIANWPFGMYWVQLDFPDDESGVLPLQVVR